MTDCEQCKDNFYHMFDDITDEVIEDTYCKRCAERKERGSGVD